MNQILFVDSDPKALAVLQSALSTGPTGWNATYVTSGQAALNLLANRWFDVVFTGLGLGSPGGMDGIELLGHVQRHHPSIIRVLLAEPLDDDRLDRALAIAQRFVAKPWDLQTLVAHLGGDRPLGRRGGKGRERILDREADAERARADVGDLGSGPLFGKRPAVWEAARWSVRPARPVVPLAVVRRADRMLAPRKIDRRDWVAEVHCHS